VAWQEDDRATVIFYFRDDDGAVTHQPMYVPVALLGYAVAAAKDFAELLKAVSDCALWKFTVIYSAQDDGAAVARPGSDARQQSVLLFETADADRYALSIPGLVASKLLQPPSPYAGVQIDASDPDIAALTGATTGTGVRPIAPWGGGTDDFNWSGTYLTRLVTAYLGYDTTKYTKPKRKI
jgi:hypothetical protein